MKTTDIRQRIRFHERLRYLILIGLAFILSPGIPWPFGLDVRAQAQSLSTLDWYMAGANPERTSWVGVPNNPTASATVEIRGDLSADWYQAIEPYIPYNFQPVFYNSRAYVATSKGLYVFNLSDNYIGTNGRVEWIYPTELPFGNSPTIADINGKAVIYVGSLDHTIHAIDTTTHQQLAGYTPYQAGAGFSTNPVVVDNMILAGNRDGYFYGLNAQTGALLWRFKTGDSILFSPAYKNGVVYFASNDLYAYALNINNGSLRWRQGPFPSAGFFSYWPVIYTEKATGVDYVVFTSAENFRQSDGTSASTVDPEYLTPGCRNIGTEPCPAGPIIWPTSVASSTESYFRPGETLMDVHKITDYYEPGNHPDYRSTYILRADNGNEYTFDSDNDGQLEYAPFTWANVTTSGSKYPPVVNRIDNILYSTTMYDGPGWIPRGAPVGWKFGTALVSKVSSNTLANDEPLAYSGGGRLMYYALMGERWAGANDITLPSGRDNPGWWYYSYSLQRNVAPGYHNMYFMGDDEFYNNDQGWNMYGGKIHSRNGIYSKHVTAQSPPIPYQGKLYFLKGNALLAFKSGITNRTHHPLAEIVPPPTKVSLATNELMQKLGEEVLKIINAGHLRPGYFSSGFYDFNGQGRNTFDWEFGEILDYFQNPAETVVTLVEALPYLSESLQTSVKDYLQLHYGPTADPTTEYPFTSIVHVGWATGEKREHSVIPNERITRYTSFTKRTTPRCSKDACGWANYPPYSFYAAWKYAQAFGGSNPTQTARDMLSALGYNQNTGLTSKLETPAGFIADAFTVYLNGTAVNTTALNGIGVPVNDSANPLFLGGDPANNFQGSIDEVKIFNQPLTQEQIQAVSQASCPAGQNCPTPAAYWSFNEGSGSVIHNGSSLGSVLDGTLSTGSSPVTWGTGKYGGALQLDGLDDVVTVNPHPEINLYGKTNSGFSVCAWVNPASKGEGENGEWYSKGESYIRINNSSRLGARFDLDRNDASYSMVPYQSIGDWSHACVVWSNDSILAKPHVLNQFIAGYLGFLKLQQQAGYPETPAIRQVYDGLLATRINMFNKDTPFPRVSGGTAAYNYMDAISISRNFMYMVPELAEYLRDQAFDRVSEALNEYQYVAPYWFVNKFDATVGESTLHHLYDVPSLLQAKAYFDKAPQSELIKYLDVPAFAKGDLFYIQNLTAILKANGLPEQPVTGTPAVPTAVQIPGDANGDSHVDGIDYVVWLNHYGQNISGPAVGDYNNNSTVDGVDYVIWLNNYGI